MRIFNYIKEIQDFITGKKENGLTIGFVATLGGLHSGHQTLMRKAKSENDITIISLFLNPMQFRKQQFLNYPCDFAQDKYIAQQTNIEAIFYPAITEMFPYVTTIEKFFRCQNELILERDLNNFTIKAKNDIDIDNIVYVPHKLVNSLDGKLHNWSFDGAATIVYKLFQAIQPDCAYFGEKDIQQLIILQQMAEVYFPAIKVIGVPTLREVDGLPFSSRNSLLSPQAHQIALTATKSIIHGKNMIEKGERQKNIVINEIKAIIASQAEIKIDYLDIVDKYSLQPIEQIKDDIILYIAFFVNQVRLTDTLILKIAK